MIEFKSVYKRYKGGNDVLKDINLICEKGEITVFIGPSGCGKTTTMKLINRLIEPTKGNILINGKDTNEINPVELRRDIGYVIQNVGLFPHMNIARNVAAVPNLLKWDKEKTKSRSDELLRMVNLEPEQYRSRYPSELSGGQQQRVGVIRALAAEPEVILMDEPFSALDPISREQLQEELIQLQKEINKTIVFVTHDMDEALKIADKIVMMKDGEIIQAASPEQILRKPANEFVKDFIGKKRLKQATDVPVVGEVMIKKPATIFASRGLATAMKIMEQRQVDSLVVVDGEGYIEGFVSIYDVSRAFDDENKTIKDILQPFGQVLSPDHRITDAVHILDSEAVSYVPVVDDQNRLLGLLTRGSVVGYVREVHAQEGWTSNV
ncbi:MAG TPA: ABC transporter ATP-binding protein [Pseudogracilibacillus sp.]|nr:ABC transporter ATP-binding protein [Pseudogracilibacillus sp.]